MALITLIILTIIGTLATAGLFSPLEWLALIHLPFWLFVGMGLAVLSWFLGD